MTVADMRALRAALALSGWEYCGVWKNAHIYEFGHWVQALIQPRPGDVVAVHAQRPNLYAPEIHSAVANTPQEVLTALDTAIRLAQGRR